MQKLLPPTNYIDSWQLAKASFRFLSQHKDLNLLLMVALTGALTLIVCVISLIEDKEFLINPFKFYAFLTTSYFLLSLLSVYFNTALTAIVLKRLNQENASIVYGLTIAIQRFSSIFKWAFMVCTVGVVAKILESPQQFIEKMLGYSLGFYWSTAAYFVLPILIIENVHPLKAMQRSVEAVGRGWKNTISVKAFIAILFVFMLLFINEFTGQPNKVIDLMMLTTPLFLIIYILGSTLEAIIISALYMNVVQQKEPKYFDTSLLGRAFVKEKD